MLILQLQSLATLVVEESECFTAGVDGPLSHTGSMCKKHHLRNGVSYVNSYVSCGISCPFSKDCDLCACPMCER